MSAEQVALPHHVAVVGLGLIGGSIARDLSALGVRVSGFDELVDSVKYSVEAGAIETALDESLDGVAEADVIVVALPLPAVEPVFRRIAAVAKPDAVITDTCSVKHAVHRCAENAAIADRFVGSHPIAGSERSGWEASRPGLFKDARVILTTSTQPAPRLDRVRGMWTALGAKCETMSADAHDRLMAWVSHLPQLVSSALGLAIDGAGIDASALGPGGRDVTRLAASNPMLWTSIALANRDELLVAIQAMSGHLSKISAALSSRDVLTLQRLLDDACRWKTEAD